ncbi:helix-turn-helix domain-containing protein [Oceanobacillus sojae]|uniref:helix-turn-helix domain-containing protein n=1 Tax=Oceanobacillus sojae TaxID=582851 RepID=UPI0021A828B8|nr:helix-turn-helix transcriptional regulator [Oceanobacillus sojae]MCT1901903.1 helix-turn-helix domain-containing protein [Oceanobacillus sojae]
MEEFGLRLQNLREKYDYSKTEMSSKLGFTDNVYGAYERGNRRPSLETIIQLADIFNVSIDYLIRGEEYKSKVEEIPEDVTQLLHIVKELNPEPRRKLLEFLQLMQE